MTAITAALKSMLSRCTTYRSWVEQEQGPYHRDSQPLRRDIVEDRDGVPLRVGIRLVGHDGTRAHDATVEIWQCDALGRYSGFPPPDDTVVVSAERAPTTQYLIDQTFVRGRQRTDPAGMVEFSTIFPGWYPGRTVHIHLMVHVASTTLISQLYFPEEINERVLSTEPYAQLAGRDTTNHTDEIFAAGGQAAVVDVGADGDGCLAAIGLVLPASDGGPERT
jgi:protocatechuate 3,4-dioxygenase beta subunit